jgi:hypothetical protein
MKLNPKAFGLTCGILWGAGLFSLTWWVMAFEGSSPKPTGLSRLYRGYTISPRGSVIGLIWGFFDAFFGGLSFAWLYNELAGHFAESTTKPKEVAAPPQVPQPEAV